MASTLAADLAASSLTEVSSLLAAREVSAVEVTRAVLDRIETYGPALNCFVTVTAEAALRRAEALDALRASGISLGPLHGIPVALKDNITTAGVRTTGGSRVYADRVPERGATAAERLDRAGTVLVGKLSLYELATGSEHPDFGRTCNPWLSERSCGGSSSGSGAAVAAGLALGALGTDTGGSTRVPGTLCGVVSLNPTYGLVSRAGVIPMSASLDRVGPFGRTAEDVATVLQAVAGHDPRDTASVEARVPDYRRGLARGLAGRVVGVPRVQPGETFGAGVREAFETALAVLEELGATLVEVDLPTHRDAWAVAIAVSAVDFADSEGGTARERAGDYGEGARRKIRLGSLLPATAYVRAQRARQALRTGAEEVMRRCDLLATPATPVAAWPAGEIGRLTVEGVAAGAHPEVYRYTLPFSCTGHPSASVPCGFDPDGVPLGIQLVGRQLEDAAVLAAAHAYQQVTDWHRRRPPLERAAAASAPAGPTT